MTSNVYWQGIREDLVCEDREEVMKMLQALNREGSTIVMVTHSPGHADYAGRVVNMLDGRVLQERRRAA